MPIKCEKMFLKVFRMRMYIHTAGKQSIPPSTEMSKTRITSKEDTLPSQNWKIMFWAQWKMNFDERGKYEWKKSKGVGMYYKNIFGSSDKHYYKLTKFWQCRSNPINATGFVEVLKQSWNQSLISCHGHMFFHDFNYSIEIIKLVLSVGS